MLILAPAINVSQDVIKANLLNINNLIVKLVLIFAPLIPTLSQILMPKHVSIIVPLEDIGMIYLFLLIRDALHIVYHLTGETTLQDMGNVLQDVLKIHYSSEILLMGTECVCKYVLMVSSVIKAHQETGDA